MTDLFSYEAPPKTTQQLADEGMRVAGEHADAVEPDWQARAYACFERYARSHAEFMTEDVRTWAHEEGLPVPPDGRAWGAVTNRAARLKMVEVARYEKTKIPPAHATPRPVWRSLVYVA